MKLPRFTRPQVENAALVGVMAWIAIAGGLLLTCFVKYLILNGAQ